MRRAFHARGTPRVPCGRGQPPGTRRRARAPRRAGPRHALHPRLRQAGRPCHVRAAVPAALPGLPGAPIAGGGRGPGVRQSPTVVRGALRRHTVHALSVPALSRGGAGAGAALLRTPRSLQGGLAPGSFWHDRSRGCAPWAVPRGSAVLNSAAVPVFRVGRKPAREARRLMCSLAATSLCMLP